MNDDVAQETLLRGVSPEDPSPESVPFLAGGGELGARMRSFNCRHGPLLAQAMQGDEETYNEGQLLTMERSGNPEETYYTFSCSPIPDDDGGVGGIICANTDDTQRVSGERQLTLLRELAAVTVDARTVEQACERSVRALAEVQVSTDKQNIRQE